MSQKRAAIYARVSTEMQEREGTSLESQVARCRAYVEEQDWTIEHIVQEQGSGGDIDGRPKLLHLLTLAKAGQLDVVLCYAIDRLSRDVSDQGWLKREFRKAGVELVFVTGHQDPLYQAIDGAMAQNERTQICERIARGKAQTALRGKYIPGGAPPFGYQFRYQMIGKTERVVGLDEDPVTAPIVREMYTFVANGGTATGCASWLMERGIMTRKGGRWGHSSVTCIMRNPLYKGEPQTLRQQSVRDPVTQQTRVVRRPADQVVALSAEIAPPLVSPELWQRANDQLNAGRIGARRNNPAPELWLLRAGFVLCGYCGGVTSATRQKGEPAYKCTQRIQRGCQHNGVMLARELDPIVWNTVTMVLKDPAWIRQQLEEQADDPGLAERITEQQASVRRLQQEEARLAARLGELDDQTPVITRLNEVSARRKVVESELADLAFQQRHAEQLAQRLDGFDQRFLDAAERVDAMGYDERRAILRQFGVGVTLWKKDHEPRFAIDWAFDIGDDWYRDEFGDDGAWVIYTREAEPASQGVIADTRHWS
jgi:site-specific DNA recombinase